MNSTFAQRPTSSMPPEATPTTRTYRIPPDAVQVYQIRALGRLLPVLSICLMAGLLVGTQGLPGTALDLALAGIMLVGLLGVGSGTLLRHSRRAYEGYELVLSGDTLILHQAARPIIRLDREQVESLREQTGRGLEVRGNEPGQHIHIPAGIEGYAELRAILASWVPVVGD